MGHPSRSPAARPACTAAGLLVFTLGLAAAAAPVPGGGGRGGLYDDEVPAPRWESDYKGALNEKKMVVVYVQPPGEIGTPNFLRHPDIARASRDVVNFVKLTFKATDPLAKELKVTSAPTMLFLDEYGNEWRRPSSLTQSTVRDLLRLVPEEINRYVETLDRSLEQAKGREDKGDDRGAVAMYRKIAAETRRGYEQIATAREKTRQLSEKRLKDAAALLATDEKDGLQEFTNIARDYGEGPIGMRARLVLLRYAIEQNGELKGRLSDLQKLADLDGEDFAAVAKDAQDLIACIEAYGESLLGHAQRKAKRGDAESARAVYRRVVSDLSGTKAARQATDEMSKL
jgi:hypothetical protein